MAFIRPQAAAEAAAQSIASKAKMATGEASTIASTTYARLQAEANAAEVRAAVVMFKPGLEKIKNELAVQGKTLSPDDMAAHAMAWKRLGADRATRARLAARYILAKASAADETQLTKQEEKGRAVCASKRKDMDAVRNDLGVVLKSAGINPEDNVKIESKSVTLNNWLECFWMVTRALALDAEMRAQAAA